MTRHRPLLSSLCAATLVAGFAGCAQDGGDKTILITNNMVPADMCLLMPTETGPFRGAGTLDLAGSGGYLFFPLIKNLTSSNNGTLTSNRTFFAEGFRITLSSPDPVTQAAIADRDSYTILTGFSVAPDNSLFGASVQVLSSPVVEALVARLAKFESTQIVASVEVIGTLSGDQVSSNAFDFPITVCIQCLVTDLGPCDMLDSAFTVTSPGNSCNPGQDQAVQCCSTPQGNVCPAIGTKQP
ncbi:MAG: hypothetical protein KBG15_02640 [Kofleriaceae bacterium]|nr:hypothetical protein [Kofleriaceae bacterium]